MKKELEPAERALAEPSDFGWVEDGTIQLRFDYQKAVARSAG